MNTLNLFVLFFPLLPTLMGEIQKIKSLFHLTSTNFPFQVYQTTISLTQQPASKQAIINISANKSSPLRTSILSDNNGPEENSPLGFGVVPMKVIRRTKSIH